MDKLLKGAVDTMPAAKELIEVQDVLPLPEPESNGSLTNVGIVVAGVIVLAALYKFWLRYGKK